MKLLLTSSGISNPSIEEALVDLLGKPIADSSALIVPTAIYPFPDGPGGAWRAISGQTESPFSGLGWKSLGVLELTALPSIKEESWVPKLRETDALLVWGGHVMYLCYWMRHSGLADLAVDRAQPNPLARLVEQVHGHGRRAGGLGERRARAGVRVEEVDGDDTAQAVRDQHDVTLDREMVENVAQDRPTHRFVLDIVAHLAEVHRG